MPNAFESLISLLEEELTRQEAVLTATLAQGAAAHAHNLKALEEHTAILMSLAQEARRAENARTRVLRQFAQGARALPALRAVIAVAPEAYAVPLRALQGRLQTLLCQIRDETRANAIWMRMSLKVVARALSIMQPGGHGAPGSYAADGQAPAPGVLCPALIDRKG